MKVLALTIDGELTYCTASIENRGKGRCNHVAHAEDGESIDKFFSRVSGMIKSTNSLDLNDPTLTIEEIDEALRSEVDKMKQITYNLIKKHSITPTEFDWNGPISEMIRKHLTLGDEHVEGTCEVSEGVNDYGDRVNHLTLVCNFRGQEYRVDFGDVPYVDEAGVFTLHGVEYRCLPVISRNKIGYSQSWSKDFGSFICLYQRDGQNVGINIPVEGDTCRILGKSYKKDEIEKALVDGFHPDPKVDSVLKSLDFENIKLRDPDFGKDGWLTRLTDNYKMDEINDLSFRKVYTMYDQILEKHSMQMRRMGQTFRKNLSSEDGMSNGKVVIMQTNNTENIIKDLQGRSNVQLAETINPLAAYSQANKVTLVGQGGISKDTQSTMVRHAQDIFDGMSDPMDQSSGKGIGLSIFLKNSEIKNGIIMKTEESHKSLTDFVPFRNHNNPNRVSMASSQMRQAMQLINGEDPRNLGDEKSDSAWDSIKGASIGRNAKVAWVPNKKNWEDSCMVSESFAKSMTAIKTYNFKEDERWKVGDVVNQGDIVGGVVVKYPGVLQKKPSGSGFQVTSKVPFQVGDKIAGRYGDKNTCSYIVPDDKMPKVFDKATNKYVPADIVRSPLSIGKRGNIGVIMETESVDISSATAIENALKPENLKPIMMPNGKTVRDNSGTQFIMRLNQVSDEKSYSHDNKMKSSNEFSGRMSEMEKILLSTTEGRREIMDYLVNQQGKSEENRLSQTLMAIGVRKI